MVFLRLTPYCLLIIPHIASYVLLAANIDDFKSLAKKLIPENLDKEMLAVASDSNQSEKKIVNSKEYTDRNENDSQSKENKPYLKAKESAKIKLKLNLDDIVEKVKDKIRRELSIITSKNQKKKKHSKSINNEEGYTTKSHRDRLIEKDISDSLGKTNTEKKLKESRHYQDDLYKNSNLERKKHHKQRIQDNRYVAELFVASSPKYIKENKPSSLRPKNLAKQQKIPKRFKPKYSYDQENKRESLSQDSNKDDRKKNRNKYLLRPEQHKKKLVNNENIKYEGLNIEETTTNIKNLKTFNTQKTHQLFEKFDMTNNDSYEDYVTPKKDYSYEEKSSTFKTTTQLHTKYLAGLPSTNDVEIVKPESDQKYDKYSDEMDTVTAKYNKAKISAVTGEDGTSKYNWNKKKRFDIQKAVKHNKNAERPGSIKVDYLAPVLPHPTEPDQDSEQDKQPYAQQIKKITTEYDEMETVVTDELKARTESLKFEDDDQMHEYIPHNAKDTKIQGTYSKRYKNTIKDTSKKYKSVPKSATNIPKRDFYRISTPDYLGKIPIVGEKYKFDEPIPEADQEPEDLEPIGKPPSRINGKVKAD